eukprot:216160-Karenia_brevis.AAC.1
MELEWFFKLGKELESKLGSLQPSSKSIIPTSAEDNPFQRAPSGTISCPFLSAGPSSLFFSSTRGQ